MPVLEDILECAESVLERHGEAHRKAGQSRPEDVSNDVTHRVPVHVESVETKS